MSGFFLELFSEEIPSNLQKNARETILQNFKSFFENESVNFKKCSAFSTPNRLVVLFDEIDKIILRKAEEIRGPNVSAPEKAVEGFLKSNNIEKSEIFIKNTDKGNFYFFKKPEKKIETAKLLEENISKILDKTSWKKSMKWGEFSLNWARPLKSILAIFYNRTLQFNYHQLKSTNSTYIDKEFEEKIKIFKDFQSYKDYFKHKNIILEQDLRKKFIKSELEKHAKRKNLIAVIDERLLEEVTNLVENPNILLCKFDHNFLEIPKEILIITMKHHQKYFHTIDEKKKYY